VTRALLYELSDALSGATIGRRYFGRASFTRGGRSPGAVALLFTLFYGFCTGTRNIISSYLITFLAAYISSNASRKQMIVITTVVFGILCLATYYEIRFRQLTERLSARRKWSGG
jgi:hypothetical protein